MTTMAAYARISLDQNGDGLGIQRQLLDLHALAERHGWTVVEYVDNNRSAAKDTAKRPAFDRMLADVEAGRVQVIGAWHTDRLARHPRQLERIIDACEKHGASVATVQAGDLDLATPAGRAVARTLVAWAGYEVEQKGKRQARRVEQNAAAGRWSGGKPGYGYRAEAGRLVVHEAEAEVVRECVRRVLGGESLRRIAADLDARGVPTPNGARRWYPSTVRDLARSPRHAGLVVHQGREAGRGEWEAIVGEQEHRAVVRLLADDTRRTTTTQQRSRLLTGLATCAVCGERVYAAKSRRGQEAYRCGGRKHFLRVSAPIDAYVTEVLLERLRQPDVLTFLAPERVDVATAEVEAQRLRARLAEAAEAFAADDGMTMDEYRAMTERMRERLAEAEEVVASAVQAVVPVALDPARVDESWQALGLADRRRLIGTFLSVAVHPVGAGVRTFQPESVELAWRGAGG